MPPKKIPAKIRGALGAAGRAMQAAFCARMAGGRHFWALFEHLPDVDFFAKDTAGRFVAGNAGLLRRLGLRSEAELLGLRDADIHPARVAREIRADDARVMRTRQPLVDRVEALFTRSQAKDWYVTTKLPITDRRGAVIGIMGFVRPYRLEGSTVAGAERIDAAVAHIHAHHAARLSVPALAGLVHLSERQLNRRFREVFGMSPQAFLLRTRVQAASDDLTASDKPLVEIAQDHGFCHQAAFSRLFKAHTGETPRRFRELRRKSAAGIGKTRALGRRRLYGVGTPKQWVASLRLFLSPLLCLLIAPCRSFAAQARGLLAMFFRHCLIQVDDSENPGSSTAC